MYGVCVCGGGGGYTAFCEKRDHDRYLYLTGIGFLHKKCQLLENSLFKY